MDTPALQAQWLRIRKVTWRQWCADQQVPALAAPANVPRLARAPRGALPWRAPVHGAAHTSHCPR